MTPRKPSPINPPHPSHLANLRRIRQISHLLDNAIGIPGTRYRIGIDPILGIVPGGGDFVAMVFSAYMIVTAAQMGLSQEKLVQMVSNVIVDTFAGTVPVVGDLFDVAWKSNIKNLELLEEHLGSPQTGTAVNWWFVGALLGGLLLVMLLIISLSVAIIGWLASALFGG
ncbi:MULTISPECIES: DUF4112 domain-containing protein [Kamptonema]|uniref:DUF4112 domain-containing protein n=1 Tax=Kamptonema TaxID=1501433 RepID=UPI0001DAD1C5|nr:MULTISPECIES: DUF4112 domain-containing protein [Kamptonema]CBN55827.1 conserved hypothetical protein [Kamptonema sp. PCC 6506]